MSDRRADFLLIGGGLAAASCAAKLREEGARGSIMLVGREPDAPYHRPPLSKEYLRGEESRDDGLVNPSGWWEENDVELMTGTSVMKLDLAERTARLSTKEDVVFDQALLATGSNVRRLRVEGGDHDGIHYLRTHGNSDAIREDAERADRLVVVGGSYIGTEVAASLTAKGGRCTILMQEAVTLERSFGPEVGAFFQRMLEEHGVGVVGSDELERFEGSDERVERVVTKGGRELDCGCVVIGAGVMPDVMLARSAGLELGELGGVSCSSRLESSAPGIYAAGDIAEYESVAHGGRALRIEHWDVAEKQGRTAALNMLGRDIAHEELPYFFSDLADWSSMEYVGVGSGEPTIRGSMDEAEFTAFYLDEGRVTAALSVGRSEDLEQARRLIGSGTSIDRSALADSDTHLGSL